MFKQQKGKTEKQRHREREREREERVDRVQNNPADPAGVVNGPRDSGSQTNAKNKIERPFLCDLEIRISFGLARPGRTNEAIMNGRKNELG
jgi:hypothetical protein